MRSCLDALLDDPVALAEARAALLATQTGDDDDDDDDDELLDGIPGAHKRANRAALRKAHKGETEAP